MPPFCSQARSTGNCNIAGCTNRHDVERCILCDRFIPSIGMKAHVQGSKHIFNAAKSPGSTSQLPPTSVEQPRTVGGARSMQDVERHSVPPTNARQPGPSSTSVGSNRAPGGQEPEAASPHHTIIIPGVAHCDICSIYLGATGLEAHTTSKRHLELEARKAAGLPPPITPPGSKHCDACNADFPSWLFVQHVKRKDHLSRQKFADLARDALANQAPTERGPAASNGREGKARQTTVEDDRSRDPFGTSSLIAGLPQVLSTGRLCDVCCVYTSKDGFESHVAGKQHQEAREKKLSSAPLPAPPPDAMYCRACNRHYPPGLYKRHLSVSQHINRQRWLDEGLDKAKSQNQVISQAGSGVQLEDTNEDATRTESGPQSEPSSQVDLKRIGLSVSCIEGIDFGVLGEPKTGQEWTSLVATTSVILERKTPNPRLTLVRIGVYSETRSPSPHFFASPRGNSKWVKFGRPRTIEVSFTPHYEGLFEGTLELVFNLFDREEEFVVYCPLKGVAGSIQDHVYLASLDRSVTTSQGTVGGAAPYVQPSKHIPLRPPTWSRRKWPTLLPEYELPKAVVDAMQHPKYDKEYAGVLLASMRPATLSMATYQQWFQAHIWIEEGQQHQRLADLPPWDVNVVRAGDRYRIIITESSEERLPEVTLGDYVYLDDARIDERYECRVHEVETWDISDELSEMMLELRVPPIFDAYHQQTFTLRLKLNRIPLRRQHHALSTPVNRAQRFLFPAVRDIVPLIGRHEDVRRRLRLVNPLLETDERQLETVISILRQSPGSVPFIVYGPPGTGKTVTIVEAILQLLRADASRNILVCAPSNAATDVLTERLSGGGLTNVDLLRLNAISRNFSADGSDSVRPFTYFNADEVYAIPQLAQLVGYRVVLCTCSSAGILQGSGIPRGHFSHVFIDEAVYADEPTCIIPIKAVADEFTQIVLAGDPNQLQPVVMSKTAGRGLKRSYLQRLMSMKDVYGLPQQHGKTIVKLVKNRRSHPRIIAWSNKMFYEDELRAHADPVAVNGLLGSALLPNKEFPIVFHGIKGAEKASATRSFFNFEEASLVRWYCQQLTATENPKHRVLEEDIGVVAPYKAQARRIRRLLKNSNMKDVVVGSVEQLQGQERKVIIISTSRSGIDSKREEEDAPADNRSIGFIGEGRRMNVAFTRAKSMLVVIGDPSALGRSQLWRFFLNFVKIYGGCKGRPLRWNAGENVDPPGYEREDVPVHEWVRGEEFMGDVRSYIFRQ